MGTTTLNLARVFSVQGHVPPSMSSGVLLAQGACSLVDVLVDELGPDQP